MRVVVLLQPHDLAQVFEHVVFVRGVDGGRFAAGGRGRETPEVVHPADRADEVAVGHVGQGREVCLVSAVRRDPAAGFDPLPRLLFVRVRRFVCVRGTCITTGTGEGKRGGERTVQDLNPLTLKRPITAITPLEHLPLRPLALIRPRHVRHVGLVLHQLLPSTPLAHETHRHGENAFPALPRLHRARRETLAGPHVLDVVQDRDLGVPGQHEVAVHRVHGEVRGYGALGGGEALGDDGAAVDAAGAGGVPEGAGVGEDVLGKEEGRLVGGFGRGCG